MDVDDDDLHVGSNDVTLEQREKKREDKVYARRLIYASSKQKVVWSLEDIDNNKHQQQRENSLDDSDYERDHYDDFDYSDDFDYCDDDHTMTQAEYEIYDKQVLESGGFDVEVPHNVFETDLIYQCPNFDEDPELFEEIENCSRNAIDHYNRNNNTNYWFMRAVKVCSQMVAAGFNHYITFEARATAGAPMYFQALAYHHVWEEEDYIEVTFCRRKPES